MFLIYLLAFITANAQPLNPTLTRAGDTVEMIIPISIIDNNKVLADSISVNIDNNNNIEMGALTIVPAPITENNKKVLEDDFAIIASLNSKQKIKTVTINLSYKIDEIETNQNHIFTVDWPEEPKQNVFKKLTVFISSLLTETKSYSVQLILALLLGLLMSLTPCLYPMIPITIGILQSQGSSSSLAKNAGLAICYTAGIAFTFAILGLTAAFTGQLFGKIMQNPFVLWFLVGWLLYMAFGMLGVYELYTPQISQNQNALKKRGSLLTAFLFGALSGTIASPCLSPGLALLLTVVAAMADVFKGFFLLLAFGIGLGIPLTIVGTFSGSISMLPRAGMWMVEIKRLFGFMLLALSFYFAQNILTPHWLLILITICCLVAAIFFVSTIRKNDSKMLKGYKFFIIFALLATPFIKFDQYKRSLVKQISWITNIEQAQKESLEENKNLVIDFTTDYCSLCKQIESNLFERNLVAKYLQSNFIPVYINLSKTENETFQEKFAIKGVPAIIITDQNLKEIKRFGSELNDLSPIQFIALLKHYEKN